MSKLDEAFVDVAVAKRLIDEKLGERLLAFARVKRRPVAVAAGELGLIEPELVSRLARLARYRVARAEDRLFAEAAVRSRILGRDQAAVALDRQRELYGQGRGFIRLLALLRTEGQLTREQDLLIRRRAREFEAAPKKVCRGEDCRALLLLTDARCPTCGASAAEHSGSGIRAA